MSKIVPIFGLHEDEDNIKWLIQGRFNEPLNGFGLSSRECPFEIRNKALSCHHAFTWPSIINEDHMKEFNTIYKNSELFRLMAPIPYKPEAKCVYVTTKNYDEFMLLNDLLQMSHPNSPLCLPISTTKESGVEMVLRRVNSSNLGRFLLTGCTAEATAKTDTLINMSLGINGRLFLAGDKRPFYGMNRIVTVLEIEPILHDVFKIFTDIKDLKICAAQKLKEYMRHGDQIFTP